MVVDVLMWLLARSSSSSSGSGSCGWLRVIDNWLLDCGVSGSGVVRLRVVDDRLLACDGISGGSV